MDDGAQVELLGGEAGKTLAQVITHLTSENRAGAGAGAVGALFTVLENITEQVQILPHAITLTKNGAKDAKKIQDGSNFTELGRELNVPLQIATGTYNDMTAAVNRKEWADLNYRVYHLLQEERAGNVEVRIPSED